MRAALLALALVAGCPGGTTAKEPTVSNVPVLSSAGDLDAHDGQSVTVEGTYTRRMSQRKMNDPKLYFFGFVDLVLDDGGKVQLSAFRREDDEVERFAGKRVRVTGTLKMDRGAVPEYVARPDPTPTLTEPETPELVE